MTIVAFYLFGLAIPLPAPACAELGPRLDRTYVTVCDGTVVGVRDEIGNSRVWDRRTNSLTLRTAGGPTLVLAGPR